MYPWFIHVPYSSPSSGSKGDARSLWIPTPTASSLVSRSCPGFSPFFISINCISRRRTSLVYHHLLLSFLLLTLGWTGVSAVEEPSYQVKDLRCYTCNVEGFPACDDPFLLENGRLANCSMNRDDNRVELCAKIIGTVIAVSGSSSAGEISDAIEEALSPSPPTRAVMNATSEAIFEGRNFSRSRNFSFQVNDAYFGRSCFPVGDGWVWRREPYNETFILGGLTISASVYICRNTRCNSAESRVVFANKTITKTMPLLFLIFSLVWKRILST